MNNKRHRFGSFFSLEDVKALKRELGIGKSKKNNNGRESMTSKEKRVAALKAEAKKIGDLLIFGF